MKRDALLAQFAWYLVVGGSAFVVEVASFIGLMAAGLLWLPASIAAFVTAQIVNYFLSYLLAFRRGRFGRSGELMRLLAVSAIGLGFNTLFVWGFIVAGFVPLAAKITAVPCVLGWNFIGRRWFVFHKDMPERTYEATESLVARVKAWAARLARTMFAKP